MSVRYVIQNQILQHAEHCIKKAICNFDHKNHKIGDNFLVKSIFRKRGWHFTSQVSNCIDTLIYIVRFGAI